MATIDELIIRIDGDVQGLKRALRETERTARPTGMAAHRLCRRGRCEPWSPAEIASGLVGECPKTPTACGLPSGRGREVEQKRRGLSKGLRALRAADIAAARSAFHP
jgi:hypothetical protein